MNGTKKIERAHTRRGVALARPRVTSRGMNLGKDRLDSLAGAMHGYGARPKGIEGYIDVDRGDLRGIIDREKDDDL